MTPEVIATLVVGAAATFVGTVQAIIYAAQARIQRSANRQALFERRLRVFVMIERYSTRWLNLEGYMSEDEGREDYNRALQESRFIFGKRARKAIDNVERRRTEHEAVRPELTYDAYGDRMGTKSPAPRAELFRLKRAIDHLEEEVSDDMRLTK